MTQQELNLSSGPGVTLFGVGMNGDALKRARDGGVDRVVFGAPSEAKDKVLPLLDKAAALMRGM